MRTSEPAVLPTQGGLWFPPLTGASLRFLEAIGLALGCAFLPEVLRLPHGPGFDPHPAWNAVLLLASRYGFGGFLIGIAASGAGVALGSAFTSAAPALTWSRLESGPNQLALAACLLVSWVASRHCRRQAELRAERSEVDR